jgi:hypothetical protein
MKRITESEAVELYYKMFPTQKRAVRRIVDKIIKCKDLEIAAWEIRGIVFCSYRTSFSKARKIRSKFGIIDE